MVTHSIVLTRDMNLESLDAEEGVTIRLSGFRLLIRRSITDRALLAIRG
jgi:hypothetical protein